MPFYDNQELIDKLISIVGINKNAQGLPAPQNAQESDATNSLLKLITGLQKSLSATDKRDPRTAPVISHEGDVTKKLSVNSTSLESLGDLIRFLSNNKIIVGGKRVVYAKEEEKPQSDEYKPYSPETHTYGPGMRGDANIEFYVNPELLKEYVSYLQSYNAKNPIPLMEMQLKSIVGEINSDKDFGVSVDQRTQDQGSSLSDETYIDMTPKDFVGTQADLGKGSVQLFLGDIRSLDTLKGWVQKNGITSKSKEGQVGIENPNFNICLVLNSLDKRADFMANQSLSEEQKNIVAIYKRQVLEIAQQGKCPAFGGSGQQSQANSDMLIEKLVSEPPLSQADIDIGRINRFFADLESLMSNVPAIPQLKSRVDTEASALAQYMSMGAADTNFNLGWTAEAINTKIGNQHDPKVFQIVVGLLGAIVNDTASALGYFRAAYGKKDQRVNKLVAEQVGEGSYDTSSMYYANKRVIDKWKNTPVSNKPQ